MADEEKGPTSMETLLGRGELNVTKEDGTTEKVDVRQLSIAQFPKLLAAQDDEVAMACLYTGKDQDWFMSLTMESQEAVIVEGDRINADFFVRWFQRRLAKQERLLPGVTEKAIAQMAKPSSPSPNSAPPLHRAPA